jgi:shikimate 5-dehydrogenase
MTTKTESIKYEVKTKSVPTFYFIGVTTGKSSIMKVFPLWMKELGRPEITIEGVDHPMHDDPENYRRSVAQIKYDYSLGSSAIRPGRSSPHGSFSRRTVS